jgi:hypothetical protein
MKEVNSERRGWMGKRMSSGIAMACWKMKTDWENAAVRPKIIVAVNIDLQYPLNDLQQQHLQS